MDKSDEGHRADIMDEIKRLNVKLSVHEAHTAILKSKIYELELALTWLNDEEE